MQILDDFSEKSAYEEIIDKERWNESHSVLITYADSIYKNGEATLKTLSELLSKHFGSLSKVVHILPFLKSTSDGGFAVSSYDSLEEKFGSCTEDRLFIRSKPSDPENWEFNAIELWRLVSTTLHFALIQIL